MGQLSFEGMDAHESRAALGNAGDLLIKADNYKLGEILSGTWSGRVVKVIGHQKGDEVIVRKHIISLDPDSFTIGRVG
jgi:hypothetical protein